MIDGGLFFFYFFENNHSYFSCSLLVRLQLFNFGVTKLNRSTVANKW